MGLCKKAFDELKSYFSIYKRKEFEVVLDSFEFLEIISFSLVFLFGYYFFDLMKFVFSYSFTRNFGNFLPEFIGLQLLVIILLVVTILNSVRNKKELEWINSYVCLFMILLVLISNISLALKLNLFFSFLFVLFPIIYGWWKSPNWWVVITIFVMIVLLCLGTFAVNEVYGNPELGIIKLRDCSIPKQTLYDLNCTTIHGSKSPLLITSNRKFYCSSKPLMGEVNGTIIFELKNGSLKDSSFSNLSFIPPDETVKVKIEGTDEISENKSACFSSTFEYDFVTEDTLIKNREKFVAYILALFNLSIFIIPFAIFKIKNELFD